MNRILSMLAVLAVILGDITPDTAQAQMGAIRRMGGMTTPSMNGRQLRVYEEVLGLNTEQKKAAEELLSGYEADYLAAVSRLTTIQQSAQNEFSQTGDLSGIQDVMGDAMKKFRKRTDTIEKSFLDDLKSILTPDQLNRWPIVERTHRRKSTINWGSLSGESVDVIDLVDGLRLETAQQAALKETLDLYATDLDRELVSRNKVVEEMVATWLEKFMSPDMDKLKEQQTSLRNSSVKILEINKRYARQVEGQLPVEKQGEFREKVKLASFPQVYRKPYVLRAFEAVEKMTGLDASATEAIRNVREQYLREAAPANDAWATAITDEEMKEEDGMQAMARQFGRQLPEKIKAAKDARDAIDKKALDGLKALLTEDQQKKLPDPKSRPEFDFDSATSLK